jgi:hypothetical protein
MWTIAFYEIAERDVVNVTFRSGERFVECLADAALEGRIAWLSQCHFQGSGANTVGIRLLRMLAQIVMERIDVDELRIEGASRTTGAGPGHDPRPLVFRRAGAGAAAAGRGLSG